MGRGLWLPGGLPARLEDRSALEGWIVVDKRLRQGDREATKEAAKDLRQDMAGAQMGVVVGERRDELET